MNKQLITRKVIVLLVITIITTSFFNLNAAIIKVPLNPSMVINPGGYGNPERTVDEQVFAGDPLNGTAGKPITNWSANYGKPYPESILIDLGNEVNLKYIYLYDTNSSGLVDISAGTPDNWSLLFTDPLTKYMAWSQHAVSVTTRYIKITRTTLNANFAEILLYADESSVPPPAVTDMKTDSVSDTKAMISWTDPLANSTTGLFNGYLLKISNQAITDINFDQATTVAIPFTPTSGQKRSFTIQPLLKGTTYYTAIKLIGQKQNSKLSNVVNFETYYVPNQKIDKIAVSFNNVVCETIETDAANLFNEQDISGDILSGTGGNPVVAWVSENANETQYPIHAYIDLKKTYAIKHIFIRDVNNMGDFKVEFGYPGHWVELFTDKLTGYLSWNQHNENVLARYLRFTKQTSGAIASEIALYGIDIQPGMPDTIPPATISDFIHTELSDTSVTVAWTILDEPNNADVSGVDLRQSLLEIDDNTFAQANNRIQTQKLSNIGSTNTLKINNLSPGVTYHFGIKAIDNNLNFSPAAAKLSVKTTERINGNNYFIPLDKEMVINENGRESVYQIADEHAALLDTLNLTPETIVPLNPLSWYYPMGIVMDLKGRCNIKNLWYYNLKSTTNTPGALKFYKGTPFNWTLVYTDSLKKGDFWKVLSINDTVRYLRIEFSHANIKLAEIGLWGTRVEPKQENTEVTLNQTVNMSAFIGTNTFVDDPIGRLTFFGNLREYHNWSWNEGLNKTGYLPYPNNKIEIYTPSLGWDFDNYYLSLKNSGITACPDIQGNTFWMANYTGGKTNAKPVYSGQNTLLPTSYIAHGSFMFQYAARYGNVVQNDAVLKLAPDQSRVSGLNAISYIENWNEQDKWWQTRDEWFSPFEFAAMSSADYDGHLSALGTTIGVKNASPNIKMVLGGLASPSLEYLKAMKLWTDTFRNGSTPFDVINFHMYCSETVNGKSVGISPEAGQLKQKIKEFTSYRDKYLPGKEVWISEFGYDTNQGSPVAAPPIGHFTNLQTQGMWLVRSYLEIAAGGADKAFMYMLRDVDGSSSTMYNSCGITLNRDNDCAPKPAWHYLKTMSTVLHNTKFAADLSDVTRNIKIYKFENTTDSANVMVIWSPTSEDRSLDASISLPLASDSCIVVQLEKDGKYGQWTPVVASNNQMNLTITESPIFVISGLGRNKQIIGSNPEKIPLSDLMIVRSESTGTCERLIDEQTLAGDPIMGTGGNCTTAWSAGYNTASYPASAVFDLGEEVDLAYISYYDVASEGELSIWIMENNTWFKVGTDNLKRYMYWSKTAIGKKSRFIKITMESVNSNISEIVIYKSGKTDK